MSLLGPAPSSSPSSLSWSQYLTGIPGDGGWNEVVHPSHPFASPISQTGARTPLCQFFLHTSVHHFLPSYTLPTSSPSSHTSPSGKPSEMAPSVTRGLCNQELYSGPRHLTLPPPHPVVSFHFTDGGTEVPRDRAGSQGHTQGQWQCQDSPKSV